MCILKNLLTQSLRNTAIHFQKLAFQSHLEFNVWNLFQGSYLQCHSSLTVWLSFAVADLLRVKNCLALICCGKREAREC